MSLSAMELLRVDTDLDFWPALLGGHHHSSQAASCPHAPHSPPTSTLSKSSNATSRTLDSERDEKKSVPGYKRTRHSYYECCINVHVSALLEHWLDWDRPTVPNDKQPVTTTQPHIDELISHLATLPDPISRVKAYCSTHGCDVLRRTDSEGKTILHHLLEGKVRTSLPEMCQVLLDSGADPEKRDNLDDNALLKIKFLLELELFEESEKLAKLLVNCYGSNVNATDRKRRTLLTYSVAYGDRSIALTRFLLNAGAKVWPDEAMASQSRISELEEEKDFSAFPWFLKSMMKHSKLDGASETLDLLCAIMGEMPSRMKQHVHRTMMQLGKSRSLNGPLFRDILSVTLPYWTQPHKLRFICLKSIRKSLGPKRLTSGPAVSKLGLPRKLQHLVELRDCGVTSNCDDVVTTSASFSQHQKNI